MLRRDSPTPREHMSERLWMRDRMALLHSVCHHHEFVKTSHRGSHETCSPQVLTEPSTEVVSRIVFVTGVAPLRGFSTPSLPAQGSSAQLRSATSTGTSP